MAAGTTGGRRGRSIASLLALAVIASLVVAASARAAAGDPDLSFNGTGQRTYEPRGQFATVADVAVQPDGKILVLGRARGESSSAAGDIVVLRLNLDGSPDGSFGTGGTAAVDFSGVFRSGNHDDFPTAIGVQSTGKIVITGFTYIDTENQGGSRTTQYAVAARLNPNGSLDPTFGTASPDFEDNGRLFLALGSDPVGAPQVLCCGGEAQGLAILPDDRILIAAGYSSTSQRDALIALSLEPEGNRTIGFGDSGKAAIDLGTDELSAAYAIAQAPGGDVILAGNTGEYPYRFAVARLSSTGVPVSNFGAGGKRIINEPGRGAVTDMVVQPDGKIALAVDARLDASPGASAQGLLRLNPDGSTDELGGQRFRAVTSSQEATPTVEIDRNGRFLFGSTFRDGDNRSIQVSRLTPAGAFDTTFGAGTGSVSAFLGISSIGRGFSPPNIALQPDNRIVVATSASGKVDVRRYLGDPPPVQPTPTLPTPRDTSPPIISAVKQSAARWRAGSKRATFSRTLPRAARAPVGSSFSWRLSEAAKMTFTFEAIAPGRRVGRKCAAPKRSNRKKKKCSRYLKRGALIRSASAGPGKLRFQGRITSSKKLRPGPYRLRIGAMDGAGNRAADRTLRFRIVR